MLHLLVPSPSGWIEAALADLPTLLLDHAHCEMKAAASAEMFASRYPDETDFVAEMRELAAEEQDHFDRVRAIMEERDIAWRPADKDWYVVHLLKKVRSPAAHRQLDRLLIAAIIEARSCERLGMLSESLDEPNLRVFYRELFESEARHHGLFLGWARHFAGREAADARLTELVAHESAYVTTKEPTAHVHG